MASRADRRRASSRRRNGRGGRAVDSTNARIRDPVGAIVTRRSYRTKPQTSQTATVDVTNSISASRLNPRSRRRFDSRLPARTRAASSRPAARGFKTARRAFVRRDGATSRRRDERPSRRRTPSMRARRLASSRCRAAMDVADDRARAKTS